MRNVEIFARLLRARADGSVQPAISVDGPELPKELAKPEALKKGASPPGDLVKVKVKKGGVVARGYIGVR